MSEAGPSADRAQEFARILAAVDGELDWRALGATYCSEGGEDFFGDEARAAIVDAGLALAGDVSEALARIGPTRIGRSLYVGAAVAELPVILCESIVLGREVVWINRPGAEVAALDAALERVTETEGRRLPRIRTLAPDELSDPGFDHVWLVSVLTDPDAFPALHDHLYERRGELATGRGDLDDDRRRAERLVEATLATATPPFALTTTDEELAIVGPAVERAGCELELPEVARLSGIVGDPVRVGVVRAR